MTAEGQATADGAGRAVLRRNGPLAEVLLNAPPRNALTPDLRAELAAILTGLIADPGVKGIVLRGAGGGFSAGLPWGEPGAGVGPTVATLCTLIESSPKCIVAAIEGVALGAGLELAMAAHYRLSDPTARMGLPEVAVGMAPSGGGTQRLPRLIGAAEAIRLLRGGGGIGAGEAVALGLIDQVEEEGLGAAAAAAALTLPVRRSRDVVIGLRDGAAFQEAVALARTAAAPAGAAGVPAWMLDRLVDCVEAAQLLPFDQGLAYEAEVHAELAATAEAAGLIHAWRAGMLAALLPAGLAGRKLPVLTRIAVHGAGRIGATLAAQALSRGLAVVLTDPRREALIAGLQSIAARQEAELAAGRLTEAARDADWARLTPVMDPAAAAGADLALADPEAGAPPAGALRLGGLAAGAGGMALHPGAQTGGVAELALGGAISAGATLAAVALTRRLGWHLAVTGPGGPVEARLRRTLAAAIAAEEAAGHDRATIAAALADFGLGAPARAGLPAGEPGGRAILQRCLLALANEGARMLGEGVVRRPAVIDAVATGSGLFPRHHGGPMFQADLRGMLVVQAALSAAAPIAPALYQPAPLIAELLRRGRDFGAMNG